MAVARRRTRLGLKSGLSHAKPVKTGWQRSLPSGRNRPRSVLHVPAPISIGGRQRANDALNYRINLLTSIKPDALLALFAGTVGLQARPTVLRRSGLMKVNDILWQLAASFARRRTPD